MICVLVLAAGEAWESPALADLEGHPGVVVLKRCVDVDDLMHRFLASAFESGLAVDGVVAQSQAQARNLWAIREGMNLGQAQRGRHLRTDVSVPLSRLADFVAEAEAAIAAFASKADDAQLAALMQAVFDRIDGQRTNLMAGIARYGNKQAGLAAQVQARRDRMAQMESAPSPDFDAIDAEEKALDWDSRIFTDRQQSLTYVCETPVILEQRLFALGRAIASHLNP